MAIPLTVNGVTYNFPQQGDTGYATDVTNWAQALTNGCLQLGGTYALTSDLTVTGFGFVSNYYKSDSANVAHTGAVRLGKNDHIHWRNNGNTFDAGLIRGSASNSRAEDELYYTTDNTTFQQISGQPHLRARRATSDQTGISTATTIVFNSAETDTDGGFNTGTGVYTVPANKGGFYLITASVATSQSTSTGNQAISIVAAGAVVAWGGAFAVTSGGASPAVSTSALVQLAAGDTVYAQLSTTAGTCGALNSPGTQLSLTRIV